MRFKDASEKIEWEARRVAAAFRVETYTKSPEFGGQYSGRLGSVEVWWEIGKGSTDDIAIVHLLTVGGDDEHGCQVSLFDWGWEIAQDQKCEPRYRGIMARALYCLNISDERVLVQLNNPLSAHEKLELRLSMPREFWPQKWLDE